MTDIRRIARLLALAVRIMFPGKNPPCSAGISRGKPCVYCTLAKDHSGVCHAMTFSNLPRGNKDLGLFWTISKKCQ